MEDMGISESAREKLNHLCYKLMGYISFFTVGEDEVRAWTIEKGDNAVTAAGKFIPIWHGDSSGQNASNMTICFAWVARKHCGKRDCSSWKARNIWCRMGISSLSVSVYRYQEKILATRKTTTIKRRSPAKRKGISIWEKRLIWGAIAILSLLCFLSLTRGKASIADDIALLRGDIWQLLGSNSNFANPIGRFGVLISFPLVFSFGFFFSMAFCLILLAFPACISFIRVRKVSS